MKSLTEYLWFEVPGRRGFINITPKIGEFPKPECAERIPIRGSRQMWKVKIRPNSYSLH